MMSGLSLRYLASASTASMILESCFLGSQERHRLQPQAAAADGPSSVHSDLKHVAECSHMEASEATTSSHHGVQSSNVHLDAFLLHFGEIPPAKSISDRTFIRLQQRPGPKILVDMTPESSFEAMCLLSSATRPRPPCSRTCSAGCPGSSGTRRAQCSTPESVGHRPTPPWQRSPRSAQASALASRRAAARPASTAPAVQNGSKRKRKQFNSTR